MVIVPQDVVAYFIVRRQIACGERRTEVFLTGIRQILGYEDQPEPRIRLT
ncbi:hypothetical protein [Halobellus inordinatus]|nr:hypothetical protein [Halobellus ramosii]